MPSVAQEAHGAGGPWRSGSASYNAGERVPKAPGRTARCVVPSRVQGHAAALSFALKCTHVSRDAFAFVHGFPKGWECCGCCSVTMHRVAQVSLLSASSNLGPWQHVATELLS